MQHRAFEQYKSCAGLGDYIDFSQTWLGNGPVQQLDEISAALNYFAQESPSIICEIGTELGGTTFLLGQFLKDVDMVIGIDLYIKNKSLLRLFHKPRQNIILLDGSSHSKRTLRRVNQALDGGRIDLLFIDGDHRYESAALDFLLYSQMVRENGIIVFHDIVPDHFERYGKQTWAWSGGVPRLWNQLKTLYESREFISDPQQNGMGIGILKFRRSATLPDELISLNSERLGY